MTVPIATLRGNRVTHSCFVRRASRHDSVTSGKRSAAWDFHVSTEYLGTLTNGATRAVPDQRVQSLKVCVGGTHITIRGPTLIAVLVIPPSHGATPAKLC